jgi:DNA-binding transcriptional regulator YhcF (GntR family)
MMLPKYTRVAASVRAQIADGVLRPGESAPSAAALARVTGLSPLTCRKALSILLKEGALVPGRSQHARPRVPASNSTPAERTLADAECALSAALAARRRAFGLTQPRPFWERADKVLDADGELLGLHDAYRVASVSSGAADAVVVNPPVTETVSSVVTVLCISITWSDGTITTVDPPNVRGTSRDSASRP